MTQKPFEHEVNKYYYSNNVLYLVFFSFCVDFSRCGSREKHIKNILGAGFAVCASSINKCLILCLFLLLKLI